MLSDSRKLSIQQTHSPELLPVVWDLQVPSLPPILQVLKIVALMPLAMFRQSTHTML